MNRIKEYIDTWLPRKGKEGLSGDSPPLTSQDRILQDLMPTVMVPLYALISEIAYDSVRFLMANDGLWIEARKRWGHFRYPLWFSPRPLPYGPVEPLTCLTGGQVSSDVIRICREEATEKAARGIEWAGWILWSEDSGYHYLPLEILQESRVSVKFSRPDLPDNTYLVMDLHSHPFDLPNFSHTDDLDDRGGVHYSGVFSFDKIGKAKLTLRFCIDGFFFD